MRIKHLAVSVFLLLPLHVQADSNVRVLNVAETKACKPVDRQACTTTQSNAAETCLAWHMEAAEKADADGILLGQTEQTKQRKPSLSGPKTIVKTTVNADYYQCGFATADTGSASSAAPAWSSVEKRLETLESLKQKGLVTEEEYQSKRQDILKDL